MASSRPVPVAKGAFAFCRYTMAALLWTALLWHVTALVWLTAIILAVSAVVRVRRSPLVALYTATLERLHPTPVELLDEHAMRFAHTFGAALLAVNLALFRLPGGGRAGWIFLGAMAVAKTIGALGFCAAGRLYTCAVNNRGACCAGLRPRRGA